MKPKLRIPKGWRRMVPGEMLQDEDSWINPKGYICVAQLAILRHRLILTMTNGIVIDYSPDLVFITQRKPLK